MTQDSYSIIPLREFVTSMTKLVEQTNEESILIKETATHLLKLISKDNWLPDFCTIPHPEFYQQYLLHADPLERFSVVSFVWGPGQKTPIHDHCTWGLIGMLRGAEKGQRFKYNAAGKLAIDGPETMMKPELCFVGGKLIENVSESDLGQGHSEWKRQWGPPRQWHEDNLEPKRVELFPKPDFNGAKSTR